MVSTFLCSIAGGMLLALGMSRVDLIAQRFVRLLGIVAFAVSAPIGVWCVKEAASHVGPWWPVGMVASVLCSGSAAAFVLVTPMLRAKPAAARTLATAGGACGVCAACVWASLFAATPAPSAGIAALNTMDRVLGSVLLGSVTVAWLLGHAYLTATAMTIAPLRRITRLFSLAVALRCGQLVLSVLLIRYGTALGAGGPGIAALGGSWLILSLRVGVGLVALGAFAYMVGDCVKRRSTQSATGILYFASVFAYIGELSSQHLVSVHGLPL